MATQARGQLSTKVGDTISLTSSGGFVGLNGANLPSLETVAEQLVELDMPAPGQLRYQGPLPKTLVVTAYLSTRSPAANPVNFTYRVSKNGTTLERSEQTRSQWQFGGHQPISLTAVLTVVTGDVIEVAAAVSADADLEVAESSMVVQESLTDVPLETVGSLFDWSALEDQVSRNLVTSALSEQVIYTPKDGDPVALRAIFDIAGYEADLGRGIGVATGSPRLFFRNADLGRPAAQEDRVAVSGRDYTIQRVLPGARGWSHCQLHKA